MATISNITSHTHLSGGVILLQQEAYRFKMEEIDTVVLLVDSRKDFNLLVCREKRSQIFQEDHINGPIHSSQEIWKSAYL